MKIVVTCLALLICLNVHATQFRAGDAIVIASDEVIEDDLFIGAQRLTVMGTIDGDLIAGGRTVGVSGEIWGDLIAGAEHISISGRVNDDARLGAREVRITGVVASNVLSFCQNLELVAGSEIGKDLTVYAGEITVDGDIGGKLSGAVGNTVISGRIAGDVEISTESLLILPSAEIVGDLTYKSAKPAEIREGAQVHGQVVHQVKEKAARAECASKFDKLGKVFHRVKWIFRVLMLAGAIIVGLVFIAVATQTAKNTSGTLRSSPWKCLGIGLLACIIVPIAVFIVSITVVGLALGMIVLALYLICLYLAAIVFSIFLGRLLFQLFRSDTSPYLALIIGLVILFFLQLVPVLNIIISLVVLFFGLGAIIITLYREQKELKGKEMA